MKEKFLRGYLPCTAAALCLPALIIIRAGGIMGPAAVLIALLWAAAIVIMQLLIFVLDAQDFFVPKSIAVTIVSMFLSPILLFGSRSAYIHLKTGVPDVVSDIRSANPQCELISTIRSDRLGPETFYIEANVACNDRESHKCTWWYSYDKKTKRWITRPDADRVGHRACFR